jgi:hypothetical protein
MDAADLGVRSQVRKAKTSAVISPSFALRTDVQFVQRPAKASRGRLSSRANHTGTFLPSMVSHSEEILKPNPRYTGC